MSRSLSVGFRLNKRKLNWFSKRRLYVAIQLIKLVSPRGYLVQNDPTEFESDQENPVTHTLVWALEPAVMILKLT